jgi:hypothetical protein
LSSQAFVAALVICAALLAIWIMARYSGFGPRSVFWAIVNVIVAMLLLRLVPVGFDAIGTLNIPAVIYVQVFGLVLPLLVYGFLAGGWMTRTALGLLRP